jgi:hypothetical protein
MRTATAEQLEPRRFLDATAVLADGVLTVTGTDARDAIHVSLDRDNVEQLHVRLGQSDNLFDLNAVESIVINAGAGNDRIVISERTGSVYVPLTIDAGAGNDTIVTGSGNDVIVAGLGNDRVTTGAGDDQLDGGDGNDRLTGGGDDDLILAGAGRDRLAGGAGSDNLDGGGGNDAISTGVGTDAVAADATNASEVRDRAADRATDAAYEVTELSAVSSELFALHEEAVPGSQVARVEEMGGGIINVYYRFGSDPQVYRTVLDDSGPEIELVNREISPQEMREPARLTFVGRYPGAQVLSVFQHSGARDDIRYRDGEGVIQQVTTTDLIWTVDDAAEDADNDGINDHQGDGPDGGDGGPNGQDGDGQMNGKNN